MINLLLLFNNILANLLGMPLMAKDGVPGNPLSALWTLAIIIIIFFGAWIIIIFIRRKR